MSYRGNRIGGKPLNGGYQISRKVTPYEYRIISREPDCRG